MSGEATIDKLIIDIDAEVASAQNGIAAFEHVLGTLKSTVSTLTRNNSGLKKLEERIVGLSAAADGVSKLTGLAKLKGMIDDISRLDNIKGNGVNDLSKAIKKIVSASEKLESADFDRVKKQMTQLADAVDPLVQKVGSASQGLTALSQVMGRTEPTMSKSGKAYTGLGTALKDLRVKALAAVAAMQKLFVVLTDAFEQSSQYIENLNLFRVSMGESTDEAYAFAEAVNDALGIDTSDWIRYQGFFQSISKGFGMTSDKADLMSQNLTQLAYDISSFYNVSVEEAYNKVVSGFSGELEPLRRLGFALDEATLKQLAYEKGVKQSLETMTQAQKGQLRYIAMIEQAQSIGVTGDMSRTIDSASNGVRVLEARIQQLKRAIGNMLLPALSAALPYLTAFIQVLTEGAQAIADFLGFEIPKFDIGSDISRDFDNIATATDSATAATEKFKGSLAGVDQLNIIGSKQEDSGTGTGGSYDLGLELPTYDFLNGVESKTKEIAENMKRAFEELLPILEAIGIAIAGFSIGSGILKLLDFIKGPKEAPAWIETIKKLATSKTFVGIVGGLAAGVSSGTMLYQSIKKLIKGTGDLKSNIATLGSGLIIAAGAITAFILAGNPLGAVITGIGAAVGAIAGVFVGINEKQEEANRIIADTIMYADTGAPTITEFSDAFVDYFDTITNDYQKIIDTNKAFEDNQKKADAAADEIQYLTDKYAALGGTITADDAETIAANIKIVGDAISENLGTATQGIIDTLKTKFGEFITILGGDLDDTINKFYILESMGNAKLAAFNKENDEIVMRISEGTATTEDWNKLNENIALMGAGTDKTQQQIGYETLLEEANAGIVNLDFEDEKSVTDAIARVSESAAQAKATVRDAMSAQLHQLEDLEAKYRAWGIDTEYDAKYGAGEFDKLMAQTETAIKIGYGEQLQEIDKGFNDYVASVQANLNNKTREIFENTTPTLNQTMSANWEAYWTIGGVLTTDEQRENLAERKKYEGILAQYSPIQNAIDTALDTYAAETFDYSTLIGSEISNGLIAGYDSEEINNHFAHSAEEMDSAFRNSWGIHSPSTVMAENGRYIMDGLALGITENADSVFMALDFVTYGVVTRLAELKRFVESVDYSGVDTDQLLADFQTDYSVNVAHAMAYAPQQTTGAATSKAGADYGRDYDNRDIVFNGTIHTTVELDGDVVGESVDSYHHRQTYISNGRGQ